MPGNWTIVDLTFFIFIVGLLLLMVTIVFHWYINEQKIAKNDMERYGKKVGDFQRVDLDNHRKHC